MKILMICPDWFPFSAGLAQSCYENCNELIKHGHEVKLIVANEKNLDSKGLNVYPENYFIRLLGINPIILNYHQKIKKLIQWCDLICLFSYMYEMNSRISFFKKIGLIRKPVVLFYRGSFESNFLNYIPLKTKLAKIFFDNLFGRLIFKNSDLVISNSEPTLAIIRKKFNNKNKMVYINNALYYSEYPKWSKSNKRVLFIGRFVINKGIQYIPQILEKIPKDWIFTAVGGGPLMDYMQKLALQYPNLEIHNNMPHEKLIKLIQNSDILVLPTFAEGAPRAVMEASAVGIPSISFAVGDVPNIIPSNCGYSISPFDIDTFCEKLEYLIENPIKRTEMGKNARDFAKKVLDWRNVFPKLEKELIKLKNFKL